MSHPSALPTEYVGSSYGHTVGIVIPSIDDSMREALRIDGRWHAIGLVGDRVGAGPQSFSADEAVKATNAEVIRVELPYDGEGAAAHGGLILFGADDVSDARRAVEVTLAEVPRHMGDVYLSRAGHLEFEFSAHADQALEMAFGAPRGRAFAIIVGCPAPIGVFMGDVAAKAASIDVTGVISPATGSFANEYITLVSGDTGAVRACLLAARTAGLRALRALDPADPPKSITRPYIR